MVTHEPIPAGEHVPTADQRVVSFGVPWSHFEAQLALRGEASAPRISYLEGALELMTPSKEHERIKSYLGRLIEAFAIERGVELSPYGGWTLKSAPKSVGLEPDECYIVGTDQSKDTPDLAIEVVWTSGGIDKLEIYRRLGIGEVWFWREGTTEIHLLEGDRYRRSEESRLLPGFDIDQLPSLLEHPTVTQAVKAFREALRD